MRIDYKQYIQSEEWKDKSRKLREKKKHCQICGIDKDLVVHHLSYKNLGSEKSNELQVVCKDCHHDLHFTPGGKKRPLSERSLRKQFNRLRRSRAKQKQKRLHEDSYKPKLVSLETLCASFNACKPKLESLTYEAYIEYKSTRKRQLDRDYLYTAELQRDAFTLWIAKHYGDRKTQEPSEVQEYLITLINNHELFYCCTYEEMYKILSGDIKIIKVDNILYKTSQIVYAETPPIIEEL